VNRKNLWIVGVVTAACIGFLIGYGVCSYTGAKQTPGAPPAAEQAPTSGGYGR
jgi:hypothetical protein